MATQIWIVGSYISQLATSGRELEAALRHFITTSCSNVAFGMALGAVYARWKTESIEGVFLQISSGRIAIHNILRNFSSLQKFINNE
jgi:hypothetical protein